jgi:hypothetical protein
MNHPADTSLPWTLREFREVAPAADRRVLRPLLRICNIALRNGLTRAEVADVLVDLASEQLDRNALTRALMERAYRPVSAEELSAAELERAKDPERFDAEVQAAIEEREGIPK